jgi:hypothetical protein
MWKRCLSIALTVALFQVSVMPVFAIPQAQEEVRQVAKVKADIAKRGVGEKAKVRVKLHNRTELQGYISQAGEDSFTLTDSKTGQKTTVAYLDIQDVKGEGLSKGAKIAIWVSVGGVAAVLIGVLLVSHTAGNLGAIRM